MDCPHHEEIKRRIANLEERVEELQLNSATKDVEMKTVFKVLAEIKDMLKEYTSEMKTALSAFKIELDELRMKPSRFVDGAVSSLISLLLGAVVMYFIKGQ